jgi:hypothetical protein
MKWCRRCGGVGLHVDRDGDGYTVYRICIRCNGHREEPEEDEE